VNRTQKEIIIKILEQVPSPDKLLPAFAELEKLELVFRLFHQRISNLFIKITQDPYATGRVFTASQ